MTEICNHLSNLEIVSYAKCTYPLHLWVTTFFNAYAIKEKAQIGATLNWPIYSSIIAQFPVYKDFFYLKSIKTEGVKGNCGGRQSSYDFATLFGSQGCALISDSGAVS